MQKDFRQFNVLRDKNIPQWSKVKVESESATMNQKNVKKEHENLVFSPLVLFISFFLMAENVYLTKIWKLKK